MNAQRFRIVGPAGDRPRRPGATLTAEQLRSLAVLLGAGIAPRQAVRLLQRQLPQLAAALMPVADTLDRDGSLAGGLSQARLLGAGLLQVLRVAEGAGQLAPALQQIATSEEQRCLRLRALRAKLWLPWLVLLIGLLAGSLVRLQMPQHSIAALVLSAELTQLLGSAEFAGRLAPALEHYLVILQQRLELATASLFAWLPRIYYVLVFLVALDFLQP